MLPRLWVLILLTAENYRKLPRLPALASVLKGPDRSGLMARLKDSPCLLQAGGVNDRHKGSIAPDPQIDWIVDRLWFNLNERRRL